MKSTRRVAIGVVTGAVALVVAAVPAAAHVELEPGEVPANVSTRVELYVEHGCGTSPIERVVTRLPPEAVDAAADAPEGWTVSIAGNVVTWDGSARPVARDLRLGLTFVARAEPGTALGFPTIESCPNGEEVRWIDDAASTGDETIKPLPRLRVVPGAPAPPTTATPATTASPAPTAPATTTASTAPTAAAPATTGATAPATTVLGDAPAAPTAPPTSAATSSAPDAESGGAPAALFALGGIAVGGVLGVVLAARRRRGGPR